MSRLRFQMRFMSMYELTYRPPRNIDSLEYIPDEKESATWKQYYIDQRARAKLDPDLTDNQRKEILEACDAFEWTPLRTLLVRERIWD